MDWSQTVDPQNLRNLGLEGMRDDWLVDQRHPWHAFRFDATFALLSTLHALRREGRPLNGTGILEKMKVLEMQGIFGALSWDDKLNRQGLIYETLQLQILENNADPFGLM